MLRDPPSGLGHEQRLALGGFVLDLARGELYDRAGVPVGLRAQALKLLIVLGEHAGQVVGKDELMRRVWGDVIVTEDSIVQAVGDIRRALGDDEHLHLRTVARRGYMLVPAPAPAPAGMATAWSGEPPPGAAADAAAAADVSAPAVDRRRRRLWRVAGALLAVLVLVFAVAWLTVERPSPNRSLAILPFESDPPDAGDAWFVDAITSDLNAMVARWHAGLHVVGRGTMQNYKGKAADPRAVGRELAAAHVLSGRVRRDGDRVRIAVELVDAASGRVQWSQPFDIDRAELPGSVGDIAGGIAKALNIQLGDIVTQDGARLDSAQADADDIAMRAMSIFLKSLGPDNLEQARQLFEQAVARDPRSMRGWAGVSLVNSMVVSFGWTQDRTAAMARSRQALDRLEAIDSAAHLTLVARASHHLSSAEWAGQLAVAEDLVRQFPNDPTSHHHRCSSMLRLGRFDEAIPACERAIRISPNESRTPIWNGLIGMNEFMRGRYGVAAERARVPAAANSSVPFYALLVAVAVARDGRRDEAQRLADEFRVRHPNFGIARVESIWSVSNAHPQFVAGRELIIATARELGLR